MRTRTATFTIEYRCPNQPALPAFGHCTIVDRQHHAYYRWSIHQDRPQEGYELACRGGQVHYHEVETNENLFETVRRHIITSIHRSQQRTPARFHVLNWSWNAATTDLATLQQIITLLEHIRKRPGMYLGPPTVDALVHFLHGFHAGCKIAGYHVTHVPESAYHAIVEARGWAFLANKPIAEMQARGMSEFEIIEELLQIEIATWKATYNVE